MGYVHVVGDSLTDELVQAGEVLTRGLQEGGIPVKAAFWFLLPDVSRWRLMLASPEVDRLGPTNVYRKVDRILSKLQLRGPTPALEDVTLLETKDPLVSLMRVGVGVQRGSGTDLAKVRFTGNTINGRFIEDALIYKLT